MRSDIFTGSAVVVAVFAFAQKAGIDILVGAPYQQGLPDSFFGFYTVYAGYVAMAAALATGELLIAFDEGRKSRAAIYTVALLGILVGLAISTSRGGLLALGVGWLLLLLFNVRRGPVFTRGVLLLVIIAGVAYVATPQSAVLKSKNGSRPLRQVLSVARTRPVSPYMKPASTRSAKIHWARVWKLSILFKCSCPQRHRPGSLLPRARDALCRWVLMLDGWG